MATLIRSWIKSLPKKEEGWRNEKITAEKKVDSYDTSSM